MSDREPPPWLEDFQRRFGEVLRAPLDRSTGTLRAVTDGYDPSTVSEVRDAARASATERLAVYNRQYWFRLLDVMNASYALTSRLLSAWRFNEHAAAFLHARPPTTWDIDRAPDGFDDFIAAVNDLPPWVADAARLDATWRRLLHAPAVKPYRPTAEDAPRLLSSRLVPSPASAVFEERWRLFESKLSLQRGGYDAAIDAPTAMEPPRWWALLREPGGVRHFALARGEGELLRLMASLPVGEALAVMEEGCSDEEREALPERARRWLAQSVERGMWSGLEADQRSTQV
ncbi:MAG: putative DNA-binding domain-containing protein [Polyangiales bacterium]